MYAVFSQNREAVTVLIEKGANINARDGKGWNALLEAFCGHYADAEIQKTLIAAGADVNASNESGFTALMCAGPGETAELLIQKGANLNAKTNKGITAVILNSGGGVEPSCSYEMVKFLSDHGADLKARETGRGHRLFPFRVDRPLRVSQDRKVPERKRRCHGLRHQVPRPGRTQCPDPCSSQYRRPGAGAPASGQGLGSQYRHDPETGDPSSPCKVRQLRGTADRQRGEREQRRTPRASPR